MSQPPANGDGNGDGKRCPECDASDAWEMTRRHRFSPFGAVLLSVMGFWSAIAGWWLGFGYLPAGVMVAAALIVGVATRKAEICQSCGFVRPTGH